MAELRRLVAAVALLTLGACSKESSESRVDKKRATTPATDQAATAGALDSVASTGATPTPGTGPRYLRKNQQGLYVDALQFPSVPESIVEKEVQNVSTRRGISAILRRFGLAPPVDRGGEVTLQKASLVDGSNRERLLIVSFLGDPDEQGLRDEDHMVVFLATTEDARLIGLGNDAVAARTREASPISIELHELHAAGIDDVVATWSACADASSKACHGMRAWTMQRGYPERILDVVGDQPVSIDDDGAPPHAVHTGGKTLRFDAQAVAYR